MTCSLRFDDSALPALERLLDYLGLEVEWKGDMGIVSKLEYEMPPVQQDAAQRVAPVRSASASPAPKPLHPGRNQMSGFSHTLDVEGSLVRFQSILALSHEDDAFVYFALANEEVGDEKRRGTGYEMTHEDFTDMGRPGQITITVEPGDTLNPVVGIS